MLLAGTETGTHILTMPPPRHKRPWLRWALAGFVVLALVLVIDDPARDFTSNHAVISESAKDPRLRPREYELPAADLVPAILDAAGRISNWEYVGTAGVDGRTNVVFERTSRLFKLKDDVILRVEEQGQRSRLTGESRSRLEYGDLGQNPRNLRRILSELDTVLAAAHRGS
jgi:hypothetical protein